MVAALWTHVVSIWLLDVVMMLRMSRRCLPLVIALLASLICSDVSGAATAPPTPRAGDRAVKDKIAKLDEKA